MPASPRSAVLSLLVGAAAVAALSACSSSAGSSTAASDSSASPSTASASASASATPGGSFALLPESALTPILPLTYTATVNADQAMAANGVKPAITAVFDGGISRGLDYKGKTVGGIELYRFSAAVPQESRAQFVPLMVSSFAQKTPTAGTLGKAQVQLVEGARGTDITAIGWTQGNEVVIAWATGTPAVEQIATAYIHNSA